MKKLSFLLLGIGYLFFQSTCTTPSIEYPVRPNILWITAEDINPFLGAYGDEQAITPNLDALAKKGVVYNNAFATAPVCSPSRSCLITGVYATSLGTQHLRSNVNIPDFIKPYPVYLKEAGYYTTNMGKEDYNFKTGDIWHETNDSAHWQNRPKNMPFFSVFNIGTTHQSQIFGSDESYYQKYGHLIPETIKHQPDEMNIPPYHFDSPEVRKLWARYYDQVTLMDQRVGEILEQLEKDGLTENTIIFFYADHGTGMPRSKRALYDSGLKVPLLIKAPKKYQKILGLLPGTQNDELVHFADFPPTIFSLLGIDIPDYMQGVAFLGDKKQKRDYVFGHADRVDEAYEISRTVRDKRYRYIRNYLPHLPLIQDNFYTDQSEIMKELRRLKDLGNLTKAQQTMWAPTRPVEELYDTQNDPYEINNLAQHGDFQEILKKMRNALKEWAVRTKDSGLLHETDMHKLGEETTIYEALQNEEIFPVRQLLRVSDLMIEEKLQSSRIIKLLQSSEWTDRFWAVLVLRTHPLHDKEIIDELKILLDDPRSSIQLTTAQTLCELGHCSKALKVIEQGLYNEDKMVRLYAARIFEELGEKASSLTAKVLGLQEKLCPVDWSKYYELYTCWALEEALKKTNPM